MGPAAGVRRPRTPLLVERLAEAKELAPPQPREVEQELFREPRDAPEIGRRPLDMGVPRQPRRPDVRPAVPIPRQRPREMLFDNDPYGVPMGPRYTARPAHMVQHRLAKLDVFKRGDRRKVRRLPLPGGRIRYLPRVGPNGDVQTGEDTSEGSGVSVHQMIPFTPAGLD